MEIILKYFPNLSKHQVNQFKLLEALYREWNDKINVVSRKDIDQLYLRHVLHSLAIAKYIGFKPKTKILDVGTGGGFPGIPLAIVFPECSFTLIDSIGKKIKVVHEVSKSLGLNNVVALHQNVKNYHSQADFVVSRAVTAFPTFYNLVKKNVSPKNKHSLPNGIIYLKGGDLREELKDFEDRIDKIPLNRYFEEDFFEQKVIIHYY